jgi:MFS family permease
LAEIHQPSINIDFVDYYQPMNRDSRRLTLPLILAATFMYGFDLNVVNVALPSLQRELHAGTAALELVVGGYVFTYAVGLVTGGRTGDLLGYRRTFAVGMAGFTGASVLCGLARTPAELVGGRLLQGMAAAIMVPQVLALITAISRPGSGLARWPGSVSPPVSADCAARCWAGWC